LRVLKLLSNRSTLNRLGEGESVVKELFAKKTKHFLMPRVGCRVEKCPVSVKKKSKIA